MSEPVQGNRRSRVVAVILSIVGAIVLIAAGGLTGIWLAQSGAAAEAGPTLTPEPTSTSAEPTPTPSATQPAIALPADCESAFSPEFFQSMMSSPEMTLNDPMFGAQLMDDLGVRDAVIAQLLPHLDRLSCSFVPGFHDGLFSNIAIVSDPQMEVVRQRLEAMDVECLDQWGGRFCSSLVERESDEGDTFSFGGQYFVRGNILITVETLNFEADDYVENIVAKLFGGL